jgi:hypothetical protein
VISPFFNLQVHHTPNRDKSKVAILQDFITKTSRSCTKSAGFQVQKLSILAILRKIQEILQVLKFFLKAAQPLSLLAFFLAAASTMVVGWFGESTS